ncbi:MAG: ABC transporter substrate-binding protein [Anaeroplasmataceae bacterium]
MKKIIKLCLLSLCLFVVGISLTSCDNEERVYYETISINCLDANGEEITKDVPYNPERVAILDYAALDIMDVYGVGDRVVSSAKGTIDYLSKYWNKIDSGEIKNLGNLQTYNMETLQQSEPDIIFIGGRQASKYAELEAIASVVYLSVTSGSVVEDTYSNSKVIAKIFGIEDSIVDRLFTDYNTRIDALKSIAVDENGNAKTAMVLMYTSSSSISVLASTGRCSLISNEIGFRNVCSEYEDSNHGTSISFETIVALNPDYIFVLNRGYITSDGANGNAAVIADLTNSLTGATNALQQGHLVVMDNPDAWYTSEGGLNALGTMLSDLEKSILQ